jgi:hypothetical protein
VYRLFPRRRSRGFDPFSRMEDSDILRNMGQKLARDQTPGEIKRQGSVWSRAFRVLLIFACRSLV